MPKYTPTSDDMYSTKPCFICGRDVLDEKQDTCCEECKLQKVLFEKDWERLLWEDYKGEIK